jgi:hypothetical protein
MMCMRLPAAHAAAAAAITMVANEGERLRRRNPPDGLLDKHVNDVLRLLQFRQKAADRLVLRDRLVVEAEADALPILDAQNFGHVHGDGGGKFVFRDSEDVLGSRHGANHNADLVLKNGLLGGERADVVILQRGHACLVVLRFYFFSLPFSWSNRRFNFYLKLTIFHTGGGAGAPL